MEKIITCTHCQRTFKVSGPPSKAKQVPQGIICPYCEQPNEVLWPMDVGLTTIPKKQASK